jgi:hypothetical protein
VWALGEASDTGFYRARKLAGCHSSIPKAHTKSSKVFFTFAMTLSESRIDAVSKLRRFAKQSHKRLLQD